MNHGPAWVLIEDAHLAFGHCWAWRHRGVAIEDVNDGKGVLPMFRSHVFGFAATFAITLVAMCMPAQAQNGITSGPFIGITSLHSGPPSESERVDLYIATPRVPPGHAPAEGMDHTFLAFHIFDRDGARLTDPADPLTLNIPRGAVGSLSFSATCPTELECVLTADTGDGAQVLGLITPLHDRVLVRHTIDCEGFCGPGLGLERVVVGPNGETRSSISQFLLEPIPNFIVGPTSTD